MTTLPLKPKRRPYANAPISPFANAARAASSQSTLFESENFARAKEGA
jgi:hypothetical protein